MENNKVKYKFELVNDVIESSVLSNSNIIGDVYYTHVNPAKIESVEIIKVNSHITKVRNHKIYDLSEHRIIVKQTDNLNIIISDELGIETIMSNKKICDEISDTINSSFITSLDDNCEVELIRYFNRGVFANIFSKRNPDDIVDKIVDCNWVITSDKILGEISKSKKVSLNDHTCKRGLIFYGKIDHVSIYISNEVKENEMFIGKMDSITSVFNRNAEVEQFECGNFYQEGLRITLEYLFKNNGIKKLIIE